MQTTLSALENSASWIHSLWSRYLSSTKNKDIIKQYICSIFPNNHLSLNILPFLKPRNLSQNIFLWTIIGFQTYLCFTFIAWKLLSTLKLPFAKTFIWVEVNEIFIWKQNNQWILRISFSIALKVISQDCYSKNVNFLYSLLRLINLLSKEKKLKYIQNEAGRLKSCQIC